MLESATVTDVFPVSFGVAVELPLDPQPLVMPIVSRREKKEKIKNGRHEKRAESVAGRRGSHGRRLKCYVQLDLAGFLFYLRIVD